MAKKSFSANLPAEMFFTPAEEEREEITPAAPQIAPSAEEIAPSAEEIAPQATAQSGTITPPAGYRVDYGVVETKSRRVQLLMQPSLHATLKAKAAASGMSFNDYVHKALERAAEEG